MGTQSPTGRPDPSKPTTPVTSAGGVVLNPDNRVLLLKRRTEGTWVLPKGKNEPDEELVNTALREVEEESGLGNLKLERKIGMVRYTFYWRPDMVNYKKTVHYYLMSTDGKNEMNLEPDFAEYKWAELGEAAKLLTFENDRRIVRSLF